MFSLILAGEAIFSLPFHVSRYFRPTFVAVFEVTQTELGLMGSIYGVVAMIAYLFGGGLADRFSARKLLTFSLLTTSATGLYMARIPSPAEMRVLYAVWGVLTILPFWSALIRATREWGGRDQQGEAFGILDGGRGFVAALLAMMALAVFRSFFPAEEASATLEEKRTALINTIYLYTVACALSGVLVWLLVPETDPARESSTRGGRSHLWHVLRLPAIWWHALVIACAYSTYKGIDYYSQYAKDVWEWSDVRAAGISAYSAWMRPVAAIGAGYLADRVTTSRVIVGCFVLTAICYVSFTLSTPAEANVWLLWANVFSTSLGIFSLRGVYFALLEEAKITHQMTGTAVGVISFIGYSPEIFMPPVAGWLIDHWSGGASGYHALFGGLCAISIIGIMATLALRRTARG